jgi:hypothetical protein
MGHAHKDLMDQYAEQLREDVKYRREKIGLGFFLPSNASQLSQPKRGAVGFKESSMKSVNLSKMVGPSRRFRIFVPDACSFELAISAAQVRISSNG